MEHSITAKDFLFHFTHGNFQAALDIANDLQLDTDVIYKAQWKKRRREGRGQVSASDLDLLRQVKDDAWVAYECLETVVDDWGLQQTLLTIGKLRAEARTSACITDLSPEQTMAKLADSNESDLVWLRTRYYFLQYLDRLETFIEIWPTLAKEENCTFGQCYSEFRDADLVAQAIEYAATENNGALRALFTHHWQQLCPYRLAILAEIPETADPSQFDLPQVTDGLEDQWIVEEPWREEPDWVEHAAVRETLGIQIPNNQSHLPVHGFPATAETVARWYIERSQAADRVGLCSQALEWARFGQMRGAPGMDDLLVRLDWLCKYVYTTGCDESISSKDLITLSNFESLPPYEVLEGLLRHTDETRIVHDMRRLAMPWLKYCENRKNERDETDGDDDGPAQMLLYRWLLSVASDHLDWCSRVLENSKPTLPEEERIVKDDLDLSRLALALLYSTEGSIDEQVRIFESLPVFDLWDMSENEENERFASMADVFPLAETPLGLFTALQAVGAHGLTQMMDTLQIHLASAEVLARYNASVPLRWYLQEQSADSQRQLCIRLASHAAGGVESGGKQFDSDADWRELYDDMMRLHEDDNRKGIFKDLSRTEIFEIFFSTLLRCGRFRLAKDMMVGPNRDKTLDIGRAEQLILDAEQEFFDNATTGNMHEGNMKLAMECLKILPPTDIVNEQMDLIRATHTLISEYHVMDRPGIELMPIQVRQSTNRLELISKLINTRRGIYRQPEQVLKLTRQLGYQDDLVAEVQVMAMLASAALADEEFETSYNLCHATFEKAQSIEENPQRGQIRKEDVNLAAWQACFNLGKVDAYQDHARRFDLLAMALVLSPVQNVQDVLAAWRKLEFEQPSSLSQTDLILLDAKPFGSDHDRTEAEGGGWHSLLDSARRHQWRLGELLKTGDTEGKRKRDQLREMVGGWLFQM